MNCKRQMLLTLLAAAIQLHTAASGYAQAARVAPTTGKNYIVKRTPRVAASSLPELLSLPAAEQGAVIEYYDGLGRPLQTVGAAAVPNGASFNDLIIHHAYDGLGREYRQYLPLPKVQASAGGYLEAAATEQAGYYGGEPGYGETVFDGSPLSRVVEQSAPGTPWQLGSGHTVTRGYGTNAASEVALWTVADNGALTGGRSYAPGTLYRAAVQDEDGAATVEYTDFEGRVVRKVADANGLKATTDYVYDDFGRLRWVLPPKYTASLEADGTPKGLPEGAAVVQGVQELKNTTSQGRYVLAPGASLTLLPTFVGGAGFSVSPVAAVEPLDALAYYYAYDGYGRMVEKKLPGAEAVYLVYDGRDRLVAVQDGVLRSASSPAGAKWLYTRYDALNRPVETGYLGNGVTTQAAMQQLVDAAFGASPQYDTPSGDEYTKSSFPRTSDGTMDPLTYTFYDGYANGGATGLGGSRVYGQTVAANVTGLPTVSRVKELATGSWSTTATYYDEKGRVIQTVKKELYGGKVGDGITVSSKLNFVGQPEEVKEEQTFNGITNTLNRRYDYYDSGQLREVTAQLNGSPVETLASYTYDALGRVQQKLYGSGAQKQAYRYNIRGWLTQINDPDTTADLFAMKLGYEAPEVSGPQVRPQYGGSIASAVWRTKMVDGTQNKKGYGFGYDGLDRLTGSRYATTDALAASEAYTERSLGYDANGNITSLTRTDGAGAATTYSYAYSGNQLQSVNGGAAYRYDANGSATTDGRSGFTIAYNEMNLPRSVSKGGQSVTYAYDATGAKLAVTNPDGTARYYHGSMVYDQNRRLAYALHEEGTVLANSTYQYHLTDHLGSTRAVFSKSAGAGQPIALAQAADYYPFGKSFENNNVTKNRYLYNGKEQQDQAIGGTPFGWYDYGARFYDPELGRWHVQDPIVQFASPYLAMADNPIKFIDPDGMYSKFGAWWRNALWGGNGTQKVGDEYAVKLAGKDPDGAFATVLQSHGGRKHQFAGEYKKSIAYKAVGELASGSDVLSEKRNPCIWTSREIKAQTSVMLAAAGLATGNIAGITSEFVFGKFFVSATASAATQYVTQDQINFTAVGADGLLTPGSGAIVGNSLPVVWHKSTNSISLDLPTSGSNFLLNVGTSYLFGKLGTGVKSVGAREFGANSVDRTANTVFTGVVDFGSSSLSSGTGSVINRP